MQFNYKSNCNWAYVGANPLGPIDSIRLQQTMEAMGIPSDVASKLSYEIINKQWIAEGFVNAKGIYLQDFTGYHRIGINHFSMASGNGEICINANASFNAKERIKIYKEGNEIIAIPDKCNNLIQVIIPEIDRYSHQSWSIPSTSKVNSVPIASSVSLVLLGLIIMRIIK